jgi:cytochrome c biogenesis factor
MDNKKPKKTNKLYFILALVVLGILILFCIGLFIMNFESSDQNAVLISPLFLIILFLVLLAIALLLHEHYTNIRITAIGNGATFLTKEEEIPDVASAVICVVPEMKEKEVDRYVHLFHCSQCVGTLKYNKFAKHHPICSIRGSMVLQKIQKNKKSIQE